METEIWERLPEDLLYMILARLPMRVLGKMRTVCKNWNYLLSSRDALQESVPNWSLHSTPGFVIHFSWDWIVEGCGSNICKVPLLDRIIVDSCNSLFCCHEKGDPFALSIGIPGASNWRRLPPPPIRTYIFSGMTFDSSTRRCTLLLGISYINLRRIEMCIYDSESNGWTQVSMMVGDAIDPIGKAIYCNGKFHWASFPHISGNRIVSFSVTDGLWREIPLPQGCNVILPGHLAEHDGQAVVVDRKEVDCIRLWKLNEEKKYEIWREFRGDILSGFRLATVNSSGLIMAIDWENNVSIFTSQGELIVLQMRLPGLRTPKILFSFQPTGSAFECNNLWWP